MMRRFTARALATITVLVSTVLLVQPSAWGASNGGAIQVWVTVNASGNGGKIVITGVVGDYGTTQIVNSSGKPTSSGSYEKLLLKKGTMLLNGNQLKKAGNAVQPSNNTSNCSVSFKVSGPAPIVSGTNSYSGIHGTVTLTEQAAVILPKKDGKCDTSSSAKPLAQFATIVGGGAVTF